MSSAQRFPRHVVDAIRTDTILRIRAGTEPHRFIGIWAVVVEGRVFVRSWSIKPRSWYRTFLGDPVGAIRVGERELRVRAVRTRSERLKAAVDRAYRAKYNTPGAVKYARDLGRAKSRATTTELVPLGAWSRPRRMRRATQLLVTLGVSLASPNDLPAQATDASPRHLSAEETHCDTTQRQSTDTVYAYDQVDEQVKPTHLRIEDMPLRVREVLTGRSVFRFVVEPSGDVNRCTIELIEEDDPAWTASVLKELRRARYRPARRGDQTVRQLVYQIFTYNEDGRFLHGR